jgi:hypothetical protein
MQAPFGKPDGAICGLRPSRAMAQLFERRPVPGQDGSSG